MRDTLKKIQISCDDACYSDIRLSELCKKYDVELIFYWPANLNAVADQNKFKPLSHGEALRLAKDHEIGSHTITHPHLTRIPLESAKSEIEYSKYMLEDMIYTKITKFAPPRGYTNKTLTDFTMKFYEKQRLTKGKDLVHIHPISGANQHKYWLQAITDDTEELWCHSWELDRFNLWEDLEKYLNEAS